MMLHSDSTRAALRERLLKLSPGASAQWGRMSCDQMVHHLNQALRMATGELPVAAKKIPVPTFVVRFVMMRFPFPKSAPTAPEILSREHYDFESERAQCIALLDAVAKKPLGSEWPTHPVGGRFSGRQWSFIAAKHVDHHLRQFGA